MSRPYVLVANAGESTISVFRLERRTLERTSVAKGLTGCSNFVHDPARDLVYAAVKGEPAGIVTLRLDRQAGTLTPLSRFDTPRGGMNYVSLTRGGTALLGASFAGGYGIIAPATDGVLGVPVSTIGYPNLHSVLPSADGQFAYFVSLGADLVAQYRISDDLQLLPLTPATAPAPVGSGPRHLVLSADETTVYVMTEFTGEVLRYQRGPRTGLLTFLDSTIAHDTSQGLRPGALGANPADRGAIWGADIHWGPEERTLWVSERSTSTLGPLSVDLDGSLGPPETFTVTQPQPRGFATSSDGTLLVATGERSTEIAVYAVSRTGLELRQHAETGHGANWVRFV